MSDLSNKKRPEWFKMLLPEAGFSFLSVLLDSFQDPDIARFWLTTPNLDLGERTPAEVIRAGNLDEVIGVLEKISTGNQR